MMRRAPHLPAALPAAFGKKSCRPATLNEAIARWPSGPSSQSMNAWPAAAFTCGCFRGSTRITPYWLNSLASPSTWIVKSPLLPNAIHVARSVSA